MRKLFILLATMSIFLLTSCDLQKGAALLTSKPFDQDTLNKAQIAYDSVKNKKGELKKQQKIEWLKGIYQGQSLETQFTQGHRIYYTVFNPKPFLSHEIRIQLLKIDFHAPYYTYSIAFARDVEIDDSKNYATGLFCLYKDGYYVFRVFDKGKLDTPIAETEFKVNPL